MLILLYLYYFIYIHISSYSIYIYAHTALSVQCMLLTQTLPALYTGMKGFTDGLNWVNYDIGLFGSKASGGKQDNIRLPCAFA